MSVKSRILLAFKAWPLVFGAIVAICWLTTFVSEWLGHPLPQQQSLDAIRNMHGMRLAQCIAIVVFVAPLVEEAIFRFGLFAFPLWIARRFAGERVPRAVPIIVMAVSSVLFTMAHYRSGVPLNNAFVALFFFGIAQCVLCRRSGGILSTFVNHALFNATNLVFLFALPPATA